jgi:hypothetical protein
MGNDACGNAANVTVGGQYFWFAKELNKLGSQFKNSAFLDEVTGIRMARNLGTAYLQNVTP